MFGGWDRARRLNDLWSLDLEHWEWTQSTNHEIAKNCGNQESWPNRRTDHSAVLWQRSETVETMIVYGGSVEGDSGAGASQEVWFLDCSHKNIELWKWKNIKVDGPNPPGRTSHSAAIVGIGKTASMIILGGTDALRGSGRGGIVNDAWILANLGDSQARSWLKLPWNGPGVERCRHTMSVIGSDAYVWGGWDGAHTVDDSFALWHGSLDGYLTKSKNSSSDSITASSSIQRSNDQSTILQERWEAETPFRQDDLPPKVLEKALSSKRHNALMRTMHRHAVLRGRDTYIDPSSGYSVFTRLYLQRRPCCGNGCRHCPHGHKNVPKKRRSLLSSTDSESSSSLEPPSPAAALDW